METLQAYATEEQRIKRPLALSISSISSTPPASFTRRPSNVAATSTNISRRRRTVSSNYVGDRFHDEIESPFCDHFKLRSTCYDCSLESGLDSSFDFLPSSPVDHHQLRRSRPSLKGSQTGSLSLPSTSSINSCSGHDSPIVIDKTPIVATWQATVGDGLSRCNSLSAQLLTSSSQLLIECEMADESSRDESEDIGSETSCTDFEDTQTDCEIKPAAIDDWLIVTKGCSSALAQSQLNSVPTITTASYYPQPIFGNYPSSIEDNMSVTETCLKDDDDVDGSKQLYVVDARQQQQNQLAEWTFPIIVGTLVLGNVFGLSLEVGASLSTLGTYLFKQYFARFLKAL